MYNVIYEYKHYLRRSRYLLVQSQPLKHHNNSSWIVLFSYRIQHHIFLYYNKISQVPLHVWDGVFAIVVNVC